MALIHLIVGLVILLVLLVVIANRSGRIIVVNPTNLQLEINTSKNLSAHLMYTPFPRWFRSERRTQGTVKVTSHTSTVVVSPITDVTTSHSNSAPFQVTGTVTGTGSLSVNGKSRHGNHNTALVPYTVQ